MSTTHRTPPELHHSGPPGWPRIKDQRSRIVSSVQSLRPGALLTEELLRLTFELGVSAAYAEVFSGVLAPVDYCVPAEGDEYRCVSFSEDRRTSTGYLLYGSATTGTREGHPFVHSHMHWSDYAGRSLAGHMWPETVVGSPAPVAAVFGLVDAHWSSFEDLETNMPTFEPSASSPKESLMQDQYTPATVARVLPNEDITEAVLTVCKRSGYRKAVVRAGLGSLVGARFVDQRTSEVITVEGPGTEVIILTGLVSTGADGPEAQLTCTLVDKHGTVHSGLLVRGENPVAVTFELTLQPAH